MQLKELKITDFGKFHQKNISLKEGINLIYGENEAGKSTVHAFIRGMLFGIEKPRGRASKEDGYTRYQPWDTPSSYRGSLDFALEGKEYRIIRNLEKNQKSTTLLDLETGRELGDDNSKIRELLGGLTESGYVNTISMEQQKIRTGTELAAEVRNYITNLSTAKNNEVDVNKALTFLQGKKKELESKRPSKELKEIKELIESGKVQEQRADSLTDQLNNLKGDLYLAEEKLRHQKDNSTERAESTEYDDVLLKYPLMQNKLENYEKKKKQIRELREKTEALRAEIEKPQYPESGELKKGMEIIKNAGKEREEIEAEKEHLLSEVSETKGKAGKTLTGIFILILAGLLLLIAGLAGQNKIWLAGIPFLLAAVYFVRLYAGIKKAGGDCEESIKALEVRCRKNKKKIEEAFAKYNIKREEELTALYETSIKAEMQKDFKEGQIREYIGQEEQLKVLAAEEKKELLSYLMLIPDWKEKLSGREYEPEEVALLRVRSFFTGRKEEQQRAKEELYKERDRLKLLTEQIKWELNSLADNEEELLFCQEKERELLEKEEEIKTELEAVTTAMETIRSLSGKIHDSFGMVLNRKVSSLVSELTGDKYSNIKIDENLEMKTEIGDEYKAWDRLSTGTMEQFLFALRLGVSDVLYDKELPLLLDDCFAYYDDKRTRAALSYLGRSGRQILIFTCHGREREIVRELGISYNYVDLGEV